MVTANPPEYYDTFKVKMDFQDVLNELAELKRKVAELQSKE